MRGIRVAQHRALTGADLAALDDLGARLPNRRPPALPPLLHSRYATSAYSINPVSPRAAAGGFGSTVSFAIAGPVGSLRQTLFIATINAWVTAFFVCTLATNVLSTCAIAYRILTFLPDSVERVPGPTVERRAYLRMVAVIIESGLLYSAAMLALLAMWLAGAGAEYLVVDATMPLAVRPPFCLFPSHD